MELLINKSIQWFKNISEATKDITSGNASHKCPSIRGMANRSAEYLEKHKKYYSQIKWQMEEPKEEGLYIVTTDKCEIRLASFHIGFSPDIEFFKIRVTAWCKLSDIEPYKKEKK